MDRDPPEVRVSKTISWLLRHGAQGEGLQMRADGYVKVVDLLDHPKLKAQGLDLDALKGVVKADSKQRFDLILESTQGAKLESFAAPADGIWWIKARQGHSIKTVQLELKPVTFVSDIPTGIAVHGTNRVAWESISKQGLSKMKRNHIHLAQNIAGDGVISGMRSSSKILIYIDVQKALAAGIKFWLSDNGVVLTEGDKTGLLSKKFFARVVDSDGVEITGWET
ncbi:hypothetical protein HYPSUDRAFT_151253 [Hypholoma sublateritium FD-334 SS-4]|uniref:2'-phosphotransferase n=1 Tax=Hypholoma sublateritium (strain FD-334 SS-4) TaxID=945553 RepID=A0A0D2N3C0_HYPSF|nr:hypothetical protein HYPSUDRAFT_151253 [Hypholoma sublateritium FD-334 SS-4]